MRVAFRPAALRDLLAIESGQGFDDAGAARRLHSRLLDACDSLADFPELGRRTPRGELCELVTVRPYVIVYRRQADEVVIFRIVHGARLR